MFFSKNNATINLLISATSDFCLFFQDRAGLALGLLEHKRQPAKYGDTVSVIIPTFNRCELLFSRALPSVLGQTYSNLEVLVVSHGSSDETAARVAELSSRDSRVRLIEIERKTLGYPNKAEYHWLVGPVKPINAGLRVASGGWIARIDDDDEWLPNHVERLLTVADRDGLDFVSSSYEALDGVNNRVVPPEGKPAVGGVQTWIYRAFLRRVRANINCWRKSWNRVNDVDLQNRLRGLNLKFGVVDAVTVRIRPRPGETKIGSAAYLDNAVKIEAIYNVRTDFERGV
jgi:glycosyltransferase involved in cell wall biosynthesis